MAKADIYPILGSLLGVDTHNNNNENTSQNNSNNDLMQSYGYLNNNNTTLTTTATINASNNSNSNTNNNNNNNANMDPYMSMNARTNPQYMYVNNLPGSGSILERGDYMQCKHCKRFYKSIQKLQEHVRKYCLKEKKYKCVSCEYRSRRKDHVLRHARRKHSALYEQYREDEESLFVIRTEEDGSYEADVDYDGPHEDYLIPAVSMATGSGGINTGGESTSGIVGDASGSSGVPTSAMQAMGFKFGSRDLVITAVPVLQESEEDDDDYDEDGE